MAEDGQQPSAEVAKGLRFISASNGAAVRTFLASKSLDYVRALKAHVTTIAEQRKRYQAMEAVNRHLRQRHEHKRGHHAAPAAASCSASTCTRRAAVVG